tara:strand:+ start:816 stop:1076 length:261 start_codon:yes stop_codon:yes gene_type:complete
VKGGVAQHLKYSEKRMTDTTAFIVCVRAARDLVKRAKNNIERTGKKGFEYDIDSALFALSRIDTVYSESIERHHEEEISTLIHEVK